MDAYYPPAEEPATPEYVLTVLRDIHRQDSGLAPHVDYDELLSFHTTVNRWLMACNLHADRDVLELLNQAAGDSLPDAVWLEELGDPVGLTLAELCTFVARRSTRPVVRPACLAGSPCTPAGAFLTIRWFLDRARAPIGKLAPSTPLDQYALCYTDVFLGPISRLAPGALPRVRVRAPVYAAALYTLPVGLLLLTTGAIAGLASLRDAGGLLAAVSFLSVLVVVRYRLCISVRFGKLRTFRDLAEVIAGGNQPGEAAGPAGAAPSMRRMVAPTPGAEVGRRARADRPVRRKASTPPEDEMMTEATWLNAADPAVLLPIVRDRLTPRKQRLFACACCRHGGWLLREVAEVRPGAYPNAIATAERFADGEVTAEELSRAFSGADDLVFCNGELQGVEQGEMLRALYGDDPASYPARHRALSSWSDRQRAADYANDAEWFAAEVAAGALPASVDPFRDVAGPDAALVGETVWRKLLLWARQPGDERGRERERAERAAQAELVRDLFGNPLRPVFDPSWRTATVVGLATGVYADQAWERMPVLADALLDAGCADEQVLSHCRAGGPHARGCWVVDAILDRR